MTYRLPADQIRALRLRSQRLTLVEDEAGANAAQLLEELCGVQAQEPLAAALALRVRGRGLAAADVERAWAEERSIARTWCMRGTLHLLAGEDLSWLIPLLGPLFIRKSRGRCAQLNLDEDKSTRALQIIRDLLGKQGPMTRAELAGQLARRGIGAEGQAIYHLLRRAGLEGVLCFGPDRDNEPTYMLWGESARHDAPSGEAALAALARRYLAAYSPADPRDLATWSGLPLSQARAGFQMIHGELLEVEAGGQPAWLPKNRAAWLDEAFDFPAAQLLPAFDTLLLGYRHRDWILPERYAKRIHPGGGVIRPVLLLNGGAAGAWKLRRKKGQVVIAVEPFEPLPDEAIAALQGEIQDIGRFLSTEATLSD